ncbi:EAL domain-containing protein [Peteryoungia desertarenae]|uniref:EAL domain-containing protein n=1 Tax=Peteryoungia desertarenae TaxID=1813451 RepID=A0ABX6QQP1_9HYPH|nr:bifunctional diguanylate cyclase/phosphodiesterase [Peteryoungia desertarenae]QLF70961.1 EAL domain-containing protein [Peteryoungia desertarenae]
MMEVLTCIALEHDPVSLIFAVLICVSGSLLTMRLFARVRATRSTARWSWLALASVVGGASIWTTHFVAMMGYDAGVATGYDPKLTLLSLILAMSVTAIGFAISASAGQSGLVEAGGVVVGLGVASMHYIGMAGYQVQGQIVWNSSYVLASLVLAAVFGALATNRVVRPVTRFCKYGGGVALILAIVSTHFVGMTGVTVAPDMTGAMPADMLNEGMLTLVAVIVALLILALGATTYMIDLQATKASVERYRHLSLHDALTGIPNRAAFIQHLGDLINAPAGTKDRLYVFSFDLDRFKEINDVHGHAAGDHVLRVVAERLTASLQPGEFVARIGGDEFVAVSSSLITEHAAELRAAALIEAVNRPISSNGQTYHVGTSIGIAVYPTGATSVDDLLVQADVAMYRAKSTGANMACFYDISMDAASRERNALAIDMRAGFLRNEFELFFQRQNSTRTGAVIGFEVLIRWRHPVRGLVPPSEFIPIAERTGFILELGDWVLQKACEEAVKWKRPFKIAVNVAPKQLANVSLPARVAEVLEQTGLPAERLELEITESGIIGDQQHALQLIRQLKALGVKIAMDDYGTGYSSLSTLQLFPFDKIKIDRGFIDGVVSNRQSAAIVRSTLILASSLDIPVLAEGVENEEHLEFLRSEGCEEVQGYLYGKPQPISELAELVNGSDLVGAPEQPGEGPEAPADQRAA